jgi:hypothetical protein
MAMKNYNTVYLGTELKLRVGIEPMGDLHMSQYDFDIEVYCNEKSVVTASKKKGVLTNLVAIDGDEDNYIALIDTSVIGVGKLKCRVVAYIPDTDFTDDGVRSEVVVTDTGITIVK